jgi:protein TonB
MRRLDQPVSEKSRKTKLIAVLLGMVVIGGVVSYIMNSQGGKEEEKKEEFQFVEFTPPPPPPPPPVPDEPDTPPDIDELVEPMEVLEDAVPTDAPTNDLGIDIGDMAAGEGPGGFIMDIPKFGRRGRSSGDDDDSMEGAEGSEAPSPTLKTQPIYPSTLLKKGIGGKVMITAVISTSGQVIKANIKGSSGYSELDNSALQAVLKWKFKPGKRNGKEVQATCIIPYTFEVKKS